eukprot:766962-Pelagomonas_calceolata.AAC.1
MAILVDDDLYKSLHTFAQLPNTCFIPFLASFHIITDPEIKTRTGNQQASPMGSCPESTISRRPGMWDSISRGVES